MTCCLCVLQIVGSNEAAIVSAQEMINLLLDQLPAGEPHPPRFFLFSFCFALCLGPNSCAQRMRALVQCLGRFGWSQRTPAYARVHSTFSWM